MLDIDAWTRLDGLPVQESAAAMHGGGGHQPNPWVPCPGPRDAAECSYGLRELSSGVLSTSSRPSVPWEVSPQLDQQAATVSDRTGTDRMFEGGISVPDAQITHQQQAAMDSLAPVHHEQFLHQARKFANLTHT